MEQNPFLVSLVLAGLVSKLVDALKQPILQWKPQANLWWFTYLSIVGGVLLNSFVTRVNLLSGLSANEDGGVLVTGLCIGAGSWLIYEVFIDKPARVEMSATAERGGAITSGTLEVSAPEQPGEDGNTWWTTVSTQND